MRTLILIKQFSRKDLVILASALVLFLLAGFIHHGNKKPAIVISKQDEAINVNKDILLLLSGGNKRLISDILWIQTLLESDEAHYSKKDLNSWMYLRFLNIATMDPLFYQNYYWGGMYLSVIKDDILGSAKLYDMGLKYYPDDYQLNYFAGFNAYFEMGDNAKGLKYLERIQNHPSAKPFVKLLVQKLKFETSYDYEAAMIFLKNNYNETKDPIIKERQYGEIYSLQAEIDLNCLNSSKPNCNTKDFEGKNYIKINGRWQAPKPFIPYGIHRKKPASPREYQSLKK
jgi:hypothetical protein